MKIVIDRASSRGHADYGWLKTYYSFSFANYYNPERMHFGALRVLNDDTVAPKEGFDLHPHKNMEVISVPLKGYLRHGDNINNSEVISRGDIQVMSAGTGIMHSEFNDSATEYMELLQIWVIPKENNTKPKYENYDIRPLLKKDDISLFLSPDGYISILQDAWFSWGDLSKGIAKEYKLKGNSTGVYVFVIEGELKIGDITLGRRDGAGITDVEKIKIQALKDSEFLVMEVAYL